MLQNAKARTWASRKRQSSTFSFTGLGEHNSARSSAPASAQLRRALLLFCLIELMLVIDESLTVAGLFAEFFEARGWNVGICTDGECAMDQLSASTPYDVVLLSYRVPGIDGLRLNRHIRA